MCSKIIRNKSSSMMKFLLLLFFLFSIAMAAPIARRMVDMTHEFGETNFRYPGMRKFEMTVVHNGTFLDSGVWMQAEEYSSGTHVGTHMDAPNHFAVGGLSIDQIPISKFIAPAAVIDITAKAQLDPDAEATVEDLTQWEALTGQNLNGTILLLRSGWGKKWGNKTAFYGTPDDDPAKLHFPGLAPEAAQWLVDNRDINGIGTDTLSFDVGRSTDYMAHQILLGHGMFGLENVANMEEIPIYGATLYVMPMKMHLASGAPTRIIATYPEVIFSPQSTN